MLEIFDNYIEIYGNIFLILVVITIGDGGNSFPSVNIRDVPIASIILTNSLQ